MEEAYPCFISCRRQNVRTCIAGGVRYGTSFFRKNNKNPVWSSCGIISSDWMNDRIGTLSKTSLFVEEVYTVYRCTANGLYGGGGKRWGAREKMGTSKVFFIHASWVRTLIRSSSKRFFVIFRKAWRRYRVNRWNQMTNSTIMVSLTWWTWMDGWVYLSPSCPRHMT